ncbi:MAG: hypothetical protein AAF610_10320 [Pseudomonadota bacterium]
MTRTWIRTLGRALWRTAISFIALVSLALAALYAESHASKEAYMSARKGQLTNSNVQTQDRGTAREQRAVRLTSDSDLSLFLRVLRDGRDEKARPALVILGGHRTGQDAVDLFTTVPGYAVVALDYPYTGPHRVRGAAQVIDALPKARRAFLDTPPAVSLVHDWLETQPWYDGTSIIVGASLGVPFAAKAASRDPRIDGVILVHGAADNARWLTVQVARRVDHQWLHKPLGTALHWLAYGPTFDTRESVANIAPRPVLIIGAERDERTPRDEVEALFDAANTPKRLRWTSGLHVEPDRRDVIDQMLSIAAEEMPFLLP